MSVELDVIGCFLPNIILSQIFSEYLSLLDVSRFDSAICNKNRRPLYLECIGSESCIFLGEKDRDISSHAISWLKFRSIELRHLQCGRVTYDTAVDIGCIGRNLYSLSINDELMVNTSVAKIVEDCPNLQHIELTRFRGKENRNMPKII
jgi:hypothetical protein